MQHCEVIVVGLGAMGSAAVYHLARQGRRVVGLDRFQPPHSFGSSHGQTRIIREAYFEHPLYVPLVQRAYELWVELEQASGQSLLQPTGGLMIGQADGTLVRGALRSAREHQLRHELLPTDALRERFAPFQPAGNMVAVWEPRAGVLFPERAIIAHLDLARASGAELHFNEPVVSWEGDGEGVLIRTANRKLAAQCLLLSAGAWTGSLLGGLSLPLAVERQVMFWFQPLGSADSFAPSQCPIFICEYDPGKFFYGLPDTGHGVKVAFHHEGESTDPDQVRRQVDEHEVQRMRQTLTRFLPLANGPLKSAAVCMYTNTPDEHFLFDRHPDHPQVWIASACSGHGFKFSPVLGEIAAASMQGLEPTFDLSLFKLGRF